MSAKKIVVALLIIVVAAGGFIAGLVLLRQNQDIQEEAAVPGGQAEVSLSPATGTYQVGQTIETRVSFNTANIAISGVAVRLTYPYSGATPEVSVPAGNIQINSALTSTGDWNCPTQTATQAGSNVVIDIACTYLGASGFTASTDTHLATVRMLVNRQPATSPLVVRFDPARSRINRQSTNEDILLIPTSTGSYTIGNATASPTTALTLTPTTTPAASVSATKTPTPVATDSGTTKGGTLPDAGISYPTVFGLGLGVMLLIGAVLLAL